MDFEESEPVERRGKQPPYTIRSFVDITCPHCKQVCAEIPDTLVNSKKASMCLQHLRVCDKFDGEVAQAPEKKRKAKHQPAQCEELVTIYKLIYLPENRAVYTGRTKDMQQRLQQHGARSSGCRLVRNAIRRHGRSKFGIEPIMRCKAADADANESYYIMANNTMYPDGYNLRHGSMAGAEAEDETRVRVAEYVTGMIAFQGVADEFRAQSEATADLADMCDQLEDCSGVEEMCRNLLRDVHPDRSGDRSYSADEVAAMINAVRESVPK